MSGPHETMHGETGHKAPDHPEHGHGVITLKGYMTGFVLAVILTAIPFWLVMTHALASTNATILIIMAFAAAQMVVHMFYFLHMDARSEAGWTLMALIFTLVLVFITLSGSLWVMYHMNANMMPMSADTARQIP